ncbi:MAG: heparan-alpha-glucosaminide N-acetyltransferase domain-containing protein [Chitinophagaceae bacterium]
MKVRFYALDVFRGATVALMILVNNPGSWNYIYSPLEHAPWHGCTPTDLVFPFFLFAVGNALAFGMPALKNGKTAPFLKKVMVRSIIIFLIGLLLNWAPFVQWDRNELVFKSLGNLRIFGVLQRIALAYLFASLFIFFLSSKNLIFLLLTILAGYWLLSWMLGQPGSPYSLEGFWGTSIDRGLLGNNHIYKGEGVSFDPEGLVSTMGSIAQVIIGYLIGSYVIRKGSDFVLATHLFVAGTLLTFLGFCWDLVYPINKKIWTSSYVLYTSGLAILILALLIYLIEIRKDRGRLTRFFEVFGKNPLFIFVLSGFLPRLLGLIRIPAAGVATQTPFAWFYQHICKPVFSSPFNASFFYALCLVGLYWSIGYLLDKKKIYIKV